MSDHGDKPYDPPKVDEIETDLPLATSPGENGTAQPG
jgi:hypothetical protein